MMECITCSLEAAFELMDENIGNKYNLKRYDNGIMFYRDSSSIPFATYNTLDKRLLINI